MSKINHNYEIYKKYKIKDIFKELEDNKIPDEIIYHEKDYKDSLKRAGIIKELINRDGLKCVHCGKIPEYFALAKDKANRWHIDLYSEHENDHYMYTIDHIYPKSKGGKNDIENYQLLCKVCNEKKGDNIEGEEPKKHKVKTNSKYINNKLLSLSQQIKGILLKLKNHKLVCIKPQKNFTVYNEYEIQDINVKVDSNFDTKFLIYLRNDFGEIVKTSFDNFITKNDYETYFKNDRSI